MLMQVLEISVSDHIKDVFYHKRIKELVTVYSAIICNNHLEFFTVYHFFSLFRITLTAAEYSNFVLITSLSFVSWRLLLLIYIIVSRIGALSLNSRPNGYCAMLTILLATCMLAFS